MRYTYRAPRRTRRAGAAGRGGSTAAKCPSSNAGRSRTSNSSSMPADPVEPEERERGSAGEHVRIPLQVHDAVAALELRSGADAGSGRCPSTRRRSSAVRPGSRRSGARRANRSATAKKPGASMSSGSVNVTHSPVACRSPRFRAAPCPAFSWATTVTGDARPVAPRLEDGARLVGRPVVDRDDLELRELEPLGLDGLDERGQVRRDVPDGGDDREARTPPSHGHPRPACVTGCGGSPGPPSWCRDPATGT